MSDSSYKVISINPSRTPSAASNPELTLRFMRRRGVIKGVYEQRNAQVAETVFGAKASKGASKLLLVARLAVGLLLVGAGAAALCGSAFVAMSAVASLIAIVGGACLATGLFERAIAGVGFLICMVSLMSVFTLGTAMLGLSLLLLAIAGPGRYSVDRRLQKNLKDRLMGNTRRSLDDYRAFSRL